jgi:WD40 repeat protein
MTACYGAIRLWRPDADEPVISRDWPGRVEAAAWGPDGRRLVHGGGEAAAYLWEPDTPDEPLCMGGFDGKVRATAWGADGRLLAVAGGQIVAVWDCKPPGPEGTKALNYDDHRGVVTCLAFRDAWLLASGGADGKVMLWAAGRARKAVAVSESGAGVSSLAWSPDRRLLAVGNEAGGVSVYSV